MPHPAAAPAPVPVPAPSPLPAVAMAPTTVVPGAAPASAPAPASVPTATTVASPATPAPPAAAAPGFFPPYAVAPPGIGFGSGMSASASSSAKRKAPEPDAAAAAAASTARSAARARRRRRASQRDHGDEFAVMDIDVDPDWSGPPSAVASDRGAGNVGFAGTAGKNPSAQATGLTTLTADDFGSGPRMPMLPGTWDPDVAGETGGHGGPA